MGDYAGARPYFEQALAIHRKALGNDHPDTASCLNNLGVLLRDGGLRGGEALLEQALAIRRKALGDGPPRHGHQPEQPGLAIPAMGDYAGARPHYEQALADPPQALGEDHPDTASSLNNLVVALERGGLRGGAALPRAGPRRSTARRWATDHPDTAKPEQPGLALCCDEPRGRGMAPDATGGGHRRPHDRPGLLYRLRKPAGGLPKAPEPS